MRSLTTLMIAAVIFGMAGMAIADLQNIEVDGSIRIRGNLFDADEGDSLDMSYVEQRTRLGVKADFTDDVSAVIEFDNYDVWGEDFRSAAYLTGADSRAASGDDVEVYQSYIQITDAWGTPITLKIGRQEIALGNQWLVGVNDVSAGFTGLSFDGVVAAYQSDVVTVCAIWAKLAETMGDFSNDDIDVYGLYGTYNGLEDIVIDAYAIYVEDDMPTLGDGTDVFWVGLRGAGVVGAIDFEAEVAYNFGDIEDVTPNFLWWGGDDLDYDAWGVNLELGYTFDCSWTPRLWAGFTWFEGDDDEDLSFNRLFSNIEYSEFIDDNTIQLSNVFIYRLGLDVAPTENVSMALVATYFEADEEVDGWDFLWWSSDDDEDLGWEIGLYADYQYSEDLVFRAGWAHFFGEDGLEDGNIVLGNGLLPLVEDDDEDYDYLFIETEIAF
jgi:hypothetical protein